MRYYIDIPKKTSSPQHKSPLFAPIPIVTLALA